LDIETPLWSDAPMAGADPILASVLQRRVQAISREMATVLMRTSRSPIFNEIGDLYDGDVILHNDVYSGGNQNADVGVFLPIFHEGRSWRRRRASLPSRARVRHV
jgi:N-methylhydantoinase B